LNCRVWPVNAGSDVLYDKDFYQQKCSKTIFIGRGSQGNHIGHKRIFVKALIREKVHANAITVLISALLPWEGLVGVVCKMGGHIPFKDAIKLPDVATCWKFLAPEAKQYPFWHPWWGPILSLGCSKLHTTCTSNFAGDALVLPLDKTHFFNQINHWKVVLCPFFPLPNSWISLLFHPNTFRLHTIPLQKWLNFGVNTFSPNIL
jgi:hypothetical protein